MLIVSPDSVYRQPRVSKRLAHDLNIVRPALLFMPSVGYSNLGSIGGAWARESDNGGATTAFGADAIGVQSNGTSSGVAAPTSVAVSGEFSVLLRVRPLSLTGAIFGRSTSGSWAIAFQSSKYAMSDSSWKDSGYTAVVGRTDTVVAVVSQTTISWFINGRVASSAARTLDPTATNTIRFLCRTNWNDAVSTAVLELGAFWPSYSIPTPVARFLSENPYSLFAPDESFIWFPDAAGGSTVTCTTGNATASGASALVSQSIASSVGNATADGVTANIIVGSSTTIACSVGNATAAGSSALLNASVVASVGNASAAGTSALLNASISASVGNATATGQQATIVSGGSTTITCSVGNASASAPVALVSKSATCSVGNASASGTTATISTGIPTTVTCAVGNASASAQDSLISKSVACSIGSATAAGTTASIIASGPSVVACVVGSAWASGPPCIVNGGQPLASRGSSGRYLATTQQSTRPSNMQRTSRTNIQG